MIYTDLIFVFAFLPIYTVACFICRENWTRDLVATAASLLFISWGRQWYYALIIIPVFLIYICGCLRQRFGAVFEVLGDIVAAASASVGVMMLTSESGLRPALLSVGSILFAIRSVGYLKEVSDGEAPEKSFPALAVYLIPLEGMLIAPLQGYSDYRAKPRRATLKKASSGLAMFIKGFFKAAVFGLSFEAVRLAATEYEAFPWLNAITLIIVTIVEVYVITASYIEMSCGLFLVAGFSPRPETPAFKPLPQISWHVSEMWHSLPRFTERCFSDLVRAAVIVVITVTAFVSGSNVGEFLGLILILMALENAVPKHHKVSDIIFTVVTMAVAFLVLVGGSMQGIASVLGAINPYAYEYDITYILNLELTRRLPWLIIGAIAVSPLYRMAAGFIREKMAESDKSYTALKIAETIACVLLLIVGTAAAI